MSSETSDTHPPLARILHWLSALVVLWATTTGLAAALLAGPELRALIASVNVSVTTLFIPVFLLRVAYRLVGRRPRPLDVSSREQRAARAGHFLLYALTALVLTSGALMMERDIEVFDWLAVPRPIRHLAVNRGFATAHRVASALLGVLILVHVAAVIRHERRGVRVLDRMLWGPVARGRRSPEVPRRARQQSLRDASGQVVFSHGEIGAMHVLAHRLSDAGREREGHRLLGRWLEGRTGAGSDWVHIHFHMALFELALGKWDEAYARFLTHILPAAATTEDALTDAPALLWRLQLEAGKHLELPWQALRRTAIERMQRPSEPFVELHNLLALAGAGDFENIDRWVRSHPLCEDDTRECILRRLAVALGACARRAYRQAAVALESLTPQLPGLGGSAAQHQLFRRLAEASRHVGRSVAGAHPDAA